MKWSLVTENEGHSIEYCSQTAAGAMLLAFGLSRSTGQSQAGLAAMFLRPNYKSDGYNTEFQCACEGRVMRREQIRV